MPRWFAQCLPRSSVVRRGFHATISLAATGHRGETPRLWSVVPAHFLLLTVAARRPLPHFFWRNFCTFNML